MSQLYCPSCNINVSGKFCSECGSPAKQQESTLACTKCGALATGKFCTECGGSTAPSWRLRNAADANARPEHARVATTSTWDSHYGTVDTSSQTIQGNSLLCRTELILEGFGDTEEEKTAREDARCNAHVERSLGREKKLVSDTVRVSRPCTKLTYVSLTIGLLS